MSAETIVERLRQFLFIVTGVVFAVTPVELVLAKHYDTAVKWIPFVLCGLGLIVVLVAWLRPQRQTLLMLRVVMVIIALGGLLGSYEHLTGNLGFALETHAGATISDVLVNAFQGASPLLAPGILGLAATLGIAATYAHPALKSAPKRVREVTMKRTT